MRTVGKWKKKHHGTAVRILFGSTKSCADCIKYSQINEDIVTLNSAPKCVHRITASRKIS